MRLRDYGIEELKLNQNDTAVVMLITSGFILFLFTVVKLNENSRILFLCGFFVFVVVKRRKTGDLTPIFFLAFWSVNAISTPKDDDGLLLALDKELEDFLIKAIDDLPKKLRDDELQHIEGSGDVDPAAVTRTSQTTEETNSRLNATVPPSTDNRTASHEVDSEAVLAQLLASIASAAQVPLEPSVTRVVERLIEDATKSEISDLLARSSTESSRITPSSVATTTTTSSSTAANWTLLPTSTVAAPTILPTSTSTEPTTTTTRTLSKVFRSTNQTLVECEEEATCYADTDCGEVTFEEISRLTIQL